MNQMRHMLGQDCTYVLADPRSALQTESVWLDGSASFPSSSLKAPVLFVMAIEEGVPEPSSIRLSTSSYLMPQAVVITVPGCNGIRAAL